MPSGSKKRKAAKKKEEEKKEANSAPNSVHGDDDQKVHDEKESDGGETNSPLSQDHRNNFAEGKEKREEDTSSIQSAITESEYVEGVNGNGEISNKVVVEEKNGIQINQEIKLEDTSAPEAVTIEHVEFGKKSRSSSSSSSGSSSDDESKFVDKNMEVIDWEKPIEYAPNFPVEAPGVVDLEQTSDLPEITQVHEVVSPILAVVTPNEESYEVSAVDPSSILVKPADLPEINTVTEAVPVVDDHGFVVAKSKVEVCDLLSETIPQAESVIVFKEEAHLDEEVNGKSESLGVPSSVIDLGSQSNVDKISNRVAEDGEGISTAIVEEDESKPLSHSSVPAVDMVNGMSTINGAEQKKDSEIESLDKQTPVALPRQPVQSTSSMGCCGLFELFIGSNR